MIQILNNQIFFFFYNLVHRSPLLDWWIVFFAHTFPYIVIILSIIFLLFHHEVLLLKYKTKNEAIWDTFRGLKQKWKEIFFVFLAVFFAWLFTILFKIIFQIPRPFNKFQDVAPLLHPTDYSFPSGHSAFFMAIAIAIFIYHKRVGCVFMVFAILIGISRIIAGIHSPLDVLGGFFIGFLISFTLIKTFKKS